MKDDPAAASYGALCRELIEEVCAAKAVSKTQLASEIGAPPEALLGLADGGLLSFELVMELARLAGCSVARTTEIERAWFVRRMKKDPTGTARRFLRLVAKLEQEVKRLEAFLRKRGLLDEYLVDRSSPSAHRIMGQERD